jgi:hypothetical protein
MNLIGRILPALALLAGALVAQEVPQPPAANLPPAPAGLADIAVPAPAPTVPASTVPDLHDPFHGDGDYERETRRKLAQAALNRCRILARGASASGSAAVLLSLAEGRNSLLKVGDSLTLDADGVLVDFEVVAVTRQSVRFQLDDGTPLMLR